MRANTMALPGDTEYARVAHRQSGNVIAPGFHLAFLFRHLNHEIITLLLNCRQQCI
jgi:hypothetical protein